MEKMEQNSNSIEGSSLKQKNIISKEGGVSNVEKSKIVEPENVEISNLDNIEESKEDILKKQEIRKEEDNKKIGEIKNFLEKPTSMRTGYSWSFKPESVWNPQKTNYSEYLDDPISRIQNYFKRFSRKEIKKRKILENNKRDLFEDFQKYEKITFNYKYGDGVIGRTGNSVGILGNGFVDCSALIFQKGENVSMIHISPAAQDSYSGLQLSLRDVDFLGHIKFALKEILNNDNKKTSNKTAGNIELNENEINDLQKLFDSDQIKATMIHGEDKISRHLPIRFATMGKTLKLPYFKTDSHYIGGVDGRLGEKFSIYANPDNIYIIGENGNTIKKGVNFPETMIDFKQKNENQ